MLDSQINKTTAIRTVGLTRSFKTGKGLSRGSKSKVVQALDGVDLNVRQGELFGLLGPNGAGKTTLIKILTTLLLPTSGKAYVDGLDVVKEASAIRGRINMVTGGEVSGYGILTVRETLWMFSQFYGVPGKVMEERMDRLLDVVDLKEEKNTKTHKLSTGMRQKLNFVRGFITDPKIIFLDEPTLGLDVETARSCRRFIRNWLTEKPNRSVLLTTHQMPEADELCDRIGIINQGKVLICDTPANLKKMVQQESIFQLEVSLMSDGLEDIRDIAGVLKLSFKHWADKSRTQLRVVLEEEGAITQVLEEVAKNQAELYKLEKSEPSLEDVFVKLVGRSIDEEDN